MSATLRVHSCVHDAHDRHEDPVEEHRLKDARQLRANVRGPVRAPQAVSHPKVHEFRVLEHAHHHHPGLQEEKSDEGRNQARR